jgi:ABC-type antimicrobial peptide transport system permease subunit
MHTILADSTIRLGSGGDGEGLIHALFLVLIIGVCVAIIWALGRWLIGAITQNPLAMKVWNGFFLIVGAIIVINFLMSLVGHGFIAY